jgi:hydroxyethylthiazole kinase-like sugar kinase family protein
MGIAGEMAAKISGDRPGTFHVELYNALHAISEADVRAGARIEI